MKAGEKMGLYEIIKDEISLENIYKDMTYLVDQVGERLSGTEEMITSVNDGMKMV